MTIVGDLIAAGTSWFLRGRRKEAARAAEIAQLEAKYVPRIRQLKLKAQELSQQAFVESAEVSKASAEAAQLEAEYNAMQAKLLTPEELAARTRNLVA